MPFFDDMELDLVPAVMSDDEILEADLVTDTANFEGERCGLCMDLVIDRGVLDCCQHWFCFTCIDNWATITNLCPLCQSEFQLITCVPVYDTVGSSKFEEEPVSREDDWCIAGKNNTLSFPSYYIDENAVVCLDGDGCKVRSGPASAEGDSYLDTSIACDKCDIWYHASCVGFDPEGTSENTWLCPRCVAHQMQNAPSLDSLEESDNQWCPANLSTDYMVEDALCGKVSVAVADAGETAIVVSMVPRDLHVEMLNESPLNFDVDKAVKGESMVLVSDANIRKFGTQTVENRATDRETATQNVDLSLTQDTFSVMPPNSFAFGELKPNNNENAANELSISGFRDITGKLCSDPHLGMKTSECQNTDETKIETVDATNNQASEDVSQTTLMENSGLDAYNTAPVAEKVPEIQNGTKRNHTNSCDTTDPKAERKTEVVPKKRRVEEKVEVGCFKDQTDTLVAHDTDKCNILADVVDKLSNNKEAPPDIMTIVKGTGRKSSATDQTSARGENAGGLRIKKIMRTAGKNEESSFLVEKLRKEIREAVRNKSSKDVEENLFDAKLLAAFRTAIVGPSVEPVKKLSPLAVKAKKSLLQKGKVRESLTKKIYGTTNGRRKRAWDRDCEVEFWKYRCTRATKPEKLETLKSVLGLLRGDSKNLEIMQEPDQPLTDSILSRLYLADASVLPRKDDIKPLSYLDANSEQKKEQATLGGKSVDHDVNSAESNKHAFNSGFSAKHGTKMPNSKHNAPVSKVLARHPEGSSASHLNSSNSGRGKDMVSKLDDLKKDKRKWALEILARKNASAGNGATSDEHEDSAILKGNFPMLAQLPKDMRPVLASTRHNRVPKSVRQKQLCRLTEHFLRNANLQTICRTAETELAVADAINIEREVADRSNSKLVYLNLCSQEIMHCTENSQSSGSIGPIPSSPLAVPTEKPEQGTEEYSDPEVEVALRAAGLLSDSPPTTPSLNIGVPGEEKDPSAEGREEVHDNVTQAGRESEIDIFSEFEHNLGDKDYVGRGSMKVSEQPEEECLSKMKEAFASSNSEILDHALDSKPSEVPLSKCCECASRRTSPVEDVGNEPDDSHKLSCDHVGELPLVRECEELYGPDKELLMSKLSAGIGGGECDLADTESLNGIAVPGDVRTWEPSQEVEQSAGVITRHKSSVGKSSCSVSQDAKFEQEDGEKHEKECSDDGSIKRKVEAYIKEHIRPLCKSGVISVEQYRWAVAKSVEKVMKYHHKAKNANFLIKEGEKVKRLAEQYVEASQQRGKTDPS